MPCLSTLPPPVTWCTPMFITMMSSANVPQTQWFDIGINYFAILTPVNCAAVRNSSPITNASVKYYKLDTVADVDADNNGYIDSTEGLLDANGVAIAPTQVNYSKGWTCVDLPTSWSWTQDTTNSWVRT